MTENEFLSVYHEPEARQEKPSVGPGEIVLGTFVGMDQDGRPLVDFAQNPSGEPLRAISTLSLTRHQLDRTVALLFSAGDLTQPVIMGLIHDPLFALIDSTAEKASASEADVAGTETDSPPADLSIPKVANVDGESVVIEGQKEVVLRCGDASITLTRSGKILIRGKYLLNRSSGVNRIMGGSVQVN